MIININLSPFICFGMSSLYVDLSKNSNSCYSKNMHISNRGISVLIQAKRKQSSTCSMPGLMKGYKGGKMKKISSKSSNKRTHKSPYSIKSVIGSSCRHQAWRRACPPPEKVGNRPRDNFEVAGGDEGNFSGFSFRK